MIALPTPLFFLIMAILGLMLGIGAGFVQEKIKGMK